MVNRCFANPLIGQFSTYWELYDAVYLFVDLKMNIYENKLDFHLLSAI